VRLGNRAWSYVCAALLLVAVKPAAQPVASSPCSPSSTRAGFGTVPSIQCPALPDAPFVAAPVNTPQQASTYEDWAWKSFVALNWPATSAPNQRGIPDLTRSFARAGNNTQGVWETWKEKRELFTQSATPADWNAPVNYPDNAKIPACAGEEAAVSALGASHRLMAQAGKAPLSLDESLQVPSQSGPGTPSPVIRCSPRSGMACVRPAARIRCSMK
jgi:hypothetical protein